MPIWDSFILLSSFDVTKQCSLIMLMFTLFSDVIGTVGGHIVVRPPLNVNGGVRDPKVETGHQSLWRGSAAVVESEESPREIAAGIATGIETVIETGIEKGNIIINSRKLTDLWEKK